MHKTKVITEKMITTICGLKVREDYYKVADNGKIFRINAKKNKETEIGSPNSLGVINVRLVMADGSYKNFKRSRIVGEYFLKGFTQEVKLKHINGQIKDDDVSNLKIIEKGETFELSDKDELNRLDTLIAKLKTDIKRVRIKIKKLKEKIGAEQ